MRDAEHIHIAGRRVGPDEPPMVIAEMSANHDGSLAQALRIIEASKAAGADAVKIQTYTADTITLKCDSADFRISGGLWDGRTLHDLYEEAHTPWEWHAPMFDHARKLGITLFSTPFDTTAVDLLEDLNCPAYKIASFEAIDLPLISYVARTGKPMIMSMGMANLSEVAEAIGAARAGGCKQLAILHCVSGYPAPASDYNLRTIPDMIERFRVVTGLSDHTLNNTTAIAGVALGAAIIEKHFTLDRSRGGPDDSFSIEATELAALCRDAKTAWEAKGRVNYDPKQSELANRKFRRSLYIVKDMKAGDTITPDVVRSIRPGYGLPPKCIEQVLGKTVKQDLPRGTPLSWDVLL